MNSLKLGTIIYYADGTCRNRDAPNLPSFKRYWTIKDQKVYYSVEPEGELCPMRYTDEVTQHLLTFLLENTLLKGCEVD